MGQVQWFEASIKRLGTKRNVFIYEIDGLLIDTGPYNALPQIQPFINKHEIEQVVITHYHEDHSGNAYWWWKERHIPIYIHNKSLEYTKVKGKYPLYRWLFWGPRPPFKALPIPDEILTKNHQFKVLNTPGHSDDHISLFEANEGWLFTGDLFITHRPTLFLKEESIPKTIKSLKKLTKLDIKYLFCAHSGKVKNGKEKLQLKLDYLLEIQDTVISLHKKGWNNREITKHLFPKKSPMILLSNKEFSHIRAIDSILNND